MIPIAKPLIGKEEIEAVIKVLESGMLVQGRVAEDFEKEFTKYVGSKYAIVTSAGGAALHTALLSHGVGKGDEVITTAFSYIMTANSILHSNAKPVFVDVEEDSFNISPNLIQEKINNKTKAIMPVHLFGNPSNLNEIKKIADENDLIIIEDACQAHGAEINNKKIGSFSTSCFSFYPTKNMTTIEGGMITTNDKDIEEKAKIIRKAGERDKRYYDVLGYSYRMSDVQAAIGLEQLKKLNMFNKKRIENAEFLSKNIKVNGIITPKVKKNFKHVYHQYTIRITDKCKKSRDDIIKLLEKNGIGYGIYYHMPIPQQKVYRDLGYKESYPIAEKLCKEVLSLPVHPSVKEEDLNKIVKVINSI